MSEWMMIFFSLFYQDLIQIIVYWNKTNQLLKMSTVKLKYTPMFSNTSKSFLIKSKDDTFSVSRKHYQWWLLQKVFEVIEVNLWQSAKPATLSLHTAFLRF